MTTATAPAATTGGGKEVYLVVYNGFMTVVSLLSFASVVFTMLNRGLGKLWIGAGHMFCFAQAAALLETVHALLGISRSGVAAAFAQWFGKSNVLLGILYFVPEVQNDLFTAVLFLSWSSGEVIRFYYYLLSIVMGPAHIPARLTWLRYNLFIPLYPLGMLCELGLMRKALPFLEQTGLHSHTFTVPGTDFTLTTNYYAFIKHLSMIYPLVWFPMYLHMWKQRASKMKKLKAKTA